MSGSEESASPRAEGEGYAPPPTDPSSTWIERGLRAALGPTQEPEERDSARDLGARILAQVDQLWQDLDDPKSLPEIGNRYDVREEIGHGGMGVVYRALDKTLGREVAIKTIRRRVSNVAELRARFVEEAKTCSALEHPGIIPIHDLVFSQDGTPFFVMKLIRGRTLASLLAEPNPDQSHRRTWLQVFERASQAIAYAHVRGVLHRDIKPSNIMVGEFGEVHVLDWGLVKIAAGTTLAPVGEQSGEYPADATRYGEVLGTAAYMAPEQARGEVHRVTTRTDVFNLGALLLEILTGSPPYPGPDSRSEVQRARNGCADRVTQQLAAAKVDFALAGIVTACLATDPRERPADASDLTKRLAAYLASESERTRRSEIAAAEARSAAQHERRVRYITMGAATLLIAIGFVAVRTVLRAEDVRRAHALSNERSIAHSLHQAELLRTAWLGSATLDLTKLHSALAASEEAVTLAKDSETAPEIQRRAIDLRNELTSTLRAAERDAALSVRLRQLRNQADNHPNPRALRDRYLATFADAGLDLETTDLEQIAAQVNSLRVAREVLDALDDFVMSYRPKQDVALRLERVAAIANAVDPDPVRREIRRAFAAADAASLLHLRNAPLDELPSETLLLLARSLRQLEENEASLATFAQAVKRFPGAARTRHDYALALIDAGSETYEDADRQFDACIAIEPTNQHFRDDRALLSLLRNRTEEAAVLLSDSLALDANNASTWSAIGKLRVGQGDSTGAIAAFRRAVQLEPDSVGLHVVLLNAMTVALRYADCVPLLDSIGSSSTDAILFPDLRAAAWVDAGDFRKGLELANQAATQLASQGGTANDSATNELVRTLAMLALRFETEGGPTEQQLESTTKWEENLALGLLASRRNQFYLATRAYAAIDDRSATDLKRIGLPWRIHGVWIALTAGVGSGDDCRTLSENELTRCRARALDWLNREIVSLNAAYDDGKASAVFVRLFCSYLRNDPRLIRAYDELEKIVLPARERMLWNALNADIDALLARIGPLHDVDTSRYLALNAQTSSATNR